MGVLYARVGGKWEAVGTSTTDRWNTAWGVVAVGSFLANSFNLSTTQTKVTANLPFTMVAGRQYRISFNCRAVQGVAGGAYIGTTLWDGTTQLTNQVLTYLPTTGFNSVDFSWVTTGSASGSYYIQMSTNVAGAIAYTATGDASFYIEDVGPVTGAVAIPNPTPAWITPTFLNSWSAHTSGFKYRAIGDVVYVQGAILWGGGTVANGTSNVCTLPVGYRPPNPRRFVCWHNNTGTPVRASVDATGMVYIDDALANGHNWDLSLIFSTTA